MRKHTPKRRSPDRRSNRQITEELIAKFTLPGHNFILAVAMKMGVRYRFSAEDREDVIAHCCYKLSRVNWRKKLREGRGRPLDNYAKSLVLNSARDEARRIKSLGLVGLTGHPMGELPSESDDLLLEEGRDGHEDRAAARQIAQMAEQLLEAGEYLCLYLLFGLDGGGERTEAQVARDAGYTRRRVGELIVSAMGKLGRSLR